MFFFFQLFGKFDPLTNQTEIWECNLHTFKIKNSCLIYADLLLRLNRSLSFFFQRESMAQILFSPPPLPGLGTSKISLPSRSIQAELQL